MARCSPAIDTGVSCQHVATGRAEPMCGVIDLNPVDTTIIGPEVANPTEVGGYENSWVASGLTCQFS